MGIYYSSHTEIDVNLPFSSLLEQHLFVLPVFLPSEESLTLLLYKNNTHTPPKLKRGILGLKNQTHDMKKKKKNLQLHLNPFISPQCTFSFFPE